MSAVDRAVRLTETTSVWRLANEMATSPFEIAAAALLATSGCTVRLYRSSNTGTAYTDAGDWGIEVPEPRGPVSFGTFAHEVGHQLLHRPDSGARRVPRWLEEVDAESFALECFDRFALRGRDRYEQNVTRHLYRSFFKALRAGASEAAIRAAAPMWWARAEAWAASEGRRPLSRTGASHV